MKHIKIYCLLLSLMVSVVCYSQSVPHWVLTPPLAENDTYSYIVEYGMADSENEARNAAMARVLQSAGNKLGVAVSTDEVNRAVQDGTDYKVIARNFKLPVNKVCEYTDMVNGKYRVHVLCQVATAGNIDVRWTPFNKCHDTSIGAAFVPGMAQLQKGQKGKAAMFIGGELLFIGGIVASYTLKSNYQSKINGTHNVALKQQYANAANACNIAGAVSVAGAVGLYVWNVVDGIVSKGQKHIVIGEAKMQITPYATTDDCGLALNINF